MNGFDLSTVTNIYLGSTPVTEVYMGTKLIWPTGTFDYATEYFTIESLEDGNQIGIVNEHKPSISISTDKQTWTTVTPDATPTYFITLNAGEKVYIKGSVYLGDSSSRKGYFTSTGQFNVYGNIMSLLYEDDFKNKTTLPSSKDSAFASLFYNVDKLISAEHLVLPATYLYSRCYAFMFSGCTSLTTVPELPATTLSTDCYAFMFRGCTSLTTAPELPATTLADSCYNSMFSGCTSLTTAPELPTITLANYCYYSMFSGCTSLTTAPKLPATTLASSCYYSMFESCTSLTTAPELPATTLSPDCYAYMFNGCKSLNYIKMLATDISASSCLERWVAGVAPSGTFVKDASATLPTGWSGIPEGWEVITT